MQSLVQTLKRKQIQDQINELAEKQYQFLSKQSFQREKLKHKIQTIQKESYRPPNFFKLQKQINRDMKDLPQTDKNEIFNNMIQQYKQKRIEKLQIKDSQKLQQLQEWVLQADVNLINILQKKVQLSGILSDEQQLGLNEIFKQVIKTDIEKQKNEFTILFAFAIQEGQEKFQTLKKKKRQKQIKFIQYLQKQQDQFGNDNIERVTELDYLNLIAPPEPMIEGDNNLPVVVEEDLIDPQLIINKLKDNIHKMQQQTKQTNNNNNRQRINNNRQRNNNQSNNRQRNSRNQLSVRVRRRPKQRVQTQMKNKRRNRQQPNFRRFQKVRNGRRLNNRNGRNINVYRNKRRQFQRRTR
eukprot:TRINITY_DN361_c0_g1_i3.p2 TRINITY_DN361_c0_g1~~TRINITY_DN361_c0_g1_i3.p2  ORF type:complete len:353 (-),score=11.98 TRINITY_DN361_c0_g1_i3:1773-2831(-)